MTASHDNQAKQQASSLKYYLIAFCLAIFVVPDLAHAITGGTADHKKFEVLQQDFKSGPEVTKACLSCHTEAARQVMKTQHWTLESFSPSTGKKVGKKALINNFCIGIAGNYADCSSCHVGYGFKDKNFDFSVEENVDCLACHDTTGSYASKKFHQLRVKCSACHDVFDKSKAREVVRKPNYSELAKRVGKPSIRSCGACHFYGGHGNASKHGDLDSSLEVADSSLDVHMDVLGLDFTCSTCHLTAGHKVSGSRYQMTVERLGPFIRGMPLDRNPVSCESCHGNSPHSAQTMKNI